MNFEKYRESVFFSFSAFPFPRFRDGQLLQKYNFSISAFPYPRFRDGQLLHKYIIRKSSGHHKDTVGT